MDKTIRSSIGGYFELELPSSNVSSVTQLHFNSGRSALAFLLNSQEINKIWLPSFTCEVVLEPVNFLGINYEFYHVNENLLPEVSFDRLNKDSAVLVNNYYGILEKEISKLEYLKNVIIDNSQSYYSTLKGGFGAFNSFRKFFGVTDGAEAFVNLPISANYNSIVRYEAIDRAKHLLGRIEVSAEEYYKEYCQNNEALRFNGIKRISNLSERIHSAIDHWTVKQIRVFNFKFLHESIGHLNKLKTLDRANQIPLVYPLLVENGDELRNHLIENRIFVAEYWPNSNPEFSLNEVENYFVENTVALPIDQRYGKFEMKIIAKTVLAYFE